MTVNELKKDILSNNLSNLYIFHGEEYYVQKVYINKIAEVTGSDLTYIESLSEITKSTGASLFATKKCYVCIDNIELSKSSNLKQDIEKLKANLGNNILILQFTKLDKRSKMSDIAKEIGVEFEHLHSVVIQKHLMENLDILPNTAKKLSDVCENDYGRCLLELDKVKNYNEQEPDKAFETLLNSGTIYQPPGDMIFDFVNAVLSCKPKLAFELLQDCKDIGEPALRLLLVLFSSIKHLLQVQSCERDIEETTGLTSWEIRNVQKYQGVYRNSELVNAMRLIRDAEVGIKTGKIEESIAVEYVLVNIM